MATINLGNIKFEWKGTYNAGTAYAVDDVVSYNGSSYVCILASTNNLPTNTTYWNVMSNKGTDADLLNITGTVQGDLYYNNGSAIARLGAGTSGQFLKTQGTGANPVWGTPAGIISSHYNEQTGSSAYSSATFTDTNAPRVTLTPASTSSKFLINATGLMFNQRGNYFSALTLFKEITGGASTNLASTSNGDMVHIRVGDSVGNGNTQYMPYAMTYLDAPNTTSELKYTVKYRAESSSDTARINYNNTQSQITVIEF
jgi:hypothetical protein